MRCSARFGLVVCLLGLGPLCERGRANSLALQFAGAVEYVYPGNALGGRVRPGSPFTGQFIFEPSTQGWYQSPGFGMLVGIGDLTLDSRGGSTFMSVTDGSAGNADSLNFESVGFDSADLHFDAAGVGFGDNSGATLSSNSLPILGQDLTVFPMRGLWAKGHGPDGTYFEFSGGLMSAVIVPEPDTLRLLLYGTAYLAVPWRVGFNTQRSKA